MNTLYYMCFVLVLGFVSGALTMFFVYKNNIKKVQNITELINSGKLNVDAVNALKDILK